MSATAFSSVKLPAHLVEQARQAAQPMRRSVASQIEYWATLGQIVEHTGLSVQEARSAIEQYEAAAARTATLAAPFVPTICQQVATRAVQADDDLFGPVLEEIYSVPYIDLSATTIDPSGRSA